MGEARCHRDLLAEVPAQVDDRDALGAGLESPHRGQGFIRAAVVHEDDLVIEAGPLHDGVDPADELGEPLLFVERRRDDRNQPWGSIRCEMLVHKGPRCALPQGQ
jgi:hypothetical protein